MFNRKLSDKDQVLKIYDCLADKGRPGSSLMQIARETNLPGALVRKYLSQFSNIFVSVNGSSRYAHNRLADSNLHTSRDAVIHKIDETLARARTDAVMLFAGAAGAIFCAIIVAVLSAAY